MTSGPESKIDCSKVYVKRSNFASEENDFDGAFAAVAIKEGMFLVLWTNFTLWKVNLCIQGLYFNHAICKASISSLTNQILCQTKLKFKIRRACRKRNHSPPSRRLRRKSMPLRFHLVYGKT